MTSIDISMLSKFENLPNEVIIEIFDYINICDAFEIFSPLNLRFHNLLRDLPLPLDIDLSLISKRNFDAFSLYVIVDNVSRLRSLRLSNPLVISHFLSFYSFDETYHRLESLVFNEIEWIQLEYALVLSRSLPCLHYLTVKNYIEMDDSSHILHLIFSLPVLKSCVLLPKSTTKPFSLSISNIDQWSSMEYFSIHRHCSIDQFLSILSYLPHLHHFSCLSLHETSFTRFDSIEPFPHLTHLSVKSWRLSFDTMKWFSSNYLSHLEMFQLCTRADDHYLMADRWERLITNELPRLRIFDFQHYWEPVGKDHMDENTYHALIDRFNSAFWIDRKWFFAHQHFLRRTNRDSVLYTINPYRRNLYELHERAHNDSCLRTDFGLNFAKRVNIDDYRAVTNNPLQFPYASELCLWGRGARGNFSFIADLSHMFQFTKLTHLSIQCPDFGLIQLVEFLNRLPNLHSLTLFSHTSYLTTDGSIQSFSTNNYIQHLMVRGRCTFDQVYLLIHLCPNVKSIELDIEEEQMETILRFLLTGKILSNPSEAKRVKSTTFKEKFSSLFSRSQQKKMVSPDPLPSDYLSVWAHQSRLLSLCFLNFDVIMEQKLRRMIEREKLLDDYSILFLCNYLYLWW